MIEQIAIRLLKEHGLRKTNARIKILQEFLESDQAYGQEALNARFKNMDRVTLYRTLLTFERKGIIHEAVDGTGKIKYAICTDDCNQHQHNDHHPHFHCTNCGRTICLEEVDIPPIKKPANYQIEQSHLVLIGLCEECQN